MFQCGTAFIRDDTQLLALINQLNSLVDMYMRFTAVQSIIGNVLGLADLEFSLKRQFVVPAFSTRFQCLVLNPVTVYSYGFLFNCTTVGQASDSTATLT